MSFEYRHAFVFTGVSEDAREIIVNTFSEFDWEEGLDVNTETVCVLAVSYTHLTLPTIYSV